MFKPHEVDLCNEIVDIINKYIDVHKPRNDDILCVLAALYAEHIKKMEKVVDNEEDVSEIRSQAVDLVASILYQDGLLDDENGTTH
jgi:hypothetical protein